MLVVFLRKSRIRRGVTKGTGAKSTGDPLDTVGPFLHSSVAELTERFQAIDTVLAKLYAEFEKTKDLYTLLQEPNDIAVSEVEPLLQRTGQYNALCILYRQRGDDLKLLDTWAK